MKEIEIQKITKEIIYFIMVKKFNQYKPSISDIYAIMQNVAQHVIRSFSALMGLSEEEAITMFCNNLQKNSSEHHFTTGNDDADKLIDMMIKEVKTGGDIEKVVDKYVKCSTPELRQKLIDGIRGINERHKLDD